MRQGRKGSRAWWVMGVEEASCDAPGTRAVDPSRHPHHRATCIHPNPHPSIHIYTPQTTDHSPQPTQHTQPHNPPRSRTAGLRYGRAWCTTWWRCSCDSEGHSGGRGHKYSGGSLRALQLPRTGALSRTRNHVARMQAQAQCGPPVARVAPAERTACTGPCAPRQRWTCP
jgi:hypothetical protein